MFLNKYLVGCLLMLIADAAFIPGQKMVMIWCGISSNETVNNEYGAYLKQNNDAISAISPTIWHLAEDGVSLTANEALMQSAAALKKQAGVSVIPTVFDNESYNQGTLKPRYANPGCSIFRVQTQTLKRTPD